MMKTRYYTLIITLFSFGSLWAQVFSPPGIYSYTNDNLGIGPIFDNAANTPTKTLDVDGTVRIRGLLQNNALDSVLVTDINGNLHWRGAASLLTGYAPLNAPNFSGNVGIGATTPTAKLDILASAVNGGEDILQLKVDDATEDYLKLSNGTGAIGQFIPSIYGYHASDERQALYLTGAIDPNKDFGIQPVMVFDSRISNTSVSTRPLFAWDSYGVRKMMLTADGSLGIGTTTPAAKLDILASAVNGGEDILQLKVDDAVEDYLKLSNGTGAAGQFIPSIYGYHASDERQALYLTGAIDPNKDFGPQPVMVFDSRISNTSVSTRPLFAWDSYGARKMMLTANGDLGIGITPNPAYKLHVNGAINAESMYNSGQLEWADFVFKKGYQLPSLIEVEQHIKKFGHLQHIPNEKEVIENGYDMGNMDAKLLQKIEELTLYTIQQQKHIETQEEQLAKQQQLIEKLTKRIEALENQ